MYVASYDLGTSGNADAKLVRGDCVTNVGLELVEENPSCDIEGCDGADAAVGFEEWGDPPVEKDGCNGRGDSPPGPKATPFVECFCATFGLQASPEVTVASPTGAWLRPGAELVSAVDSEFEADWEKP